MRSEAKAPSPTRISQRPGSIQSASGANCQKAVFQGARFGAVEQRDGQGHKTGVMWHADLSGADFSKADIRNAIFTNPKMADVKMVRANISGVAFGETDLSSVDFDGANVGAILNGYLPNKT